MEVKDFLLTRRSGTLRRTSYTKLYTTANGGFAVIADNLLNESEDSVVEMRNHELNEQLMLINQLDEDEKNALNKIINSMLTKKRMKDLLDGKVNF